MSIDGRDKAVAFSWSYFSPVINKKSEKANLNIITKI